MDHPDNRLDTLRRPGLLVHAAAHGLGDYDRDRGLRRLFGSLAVPGPGRALDALIEREAEIDAARRAKGAGYSPARHIEVLVALLAELRLVRAAREA